MAHPLVDQLRFARSRFIAGIEGTPPEDATRRLGPMNSIGWIVGHMAWQEQRDWLTRSAGSTPFPELNELVGYGLPATTPPLADMLAAWRTITSAADPLLDSLTRAGLLTTIPNDPKHRRYGSMLLRVTYHYWFHTGEAQAIRQILGHAGLPEYVGDLDGQAPYRPESS